MRGWLLLYDTVSVVLGVVAEAIVLVLYLKARNPRLKSYLVANLLTTMIAAVLETDLYFSIIGMDSPLRNFLWSSIDFLCCGLGYCIPRISGPRLPTPSSRAIERAFGLVAFLLALLLASFDLLASLHGLELWPVRGSYRRLYIATYALLSLSILYFCLSNLRNVREGRGGQPLRHYRRALTLLSGLCLVMLPAFLLVDFFGWLLPYAKSLPRDLSLLPAFLSLMSLAILVAAALEILEPGGGAGPVLVDPAFIEEKGMTKREAEILPLLLGCLSYKEIGDRLFISPGTVRTHVIHIYQKAGVKTRLELERMLRERSASGVL